MISVILATKDRSEHLARCLDSIIKNSEINFEILVIDQSRNNLSEIVAKTFKKSKIIYHHLNKAKKSEALNLGISMAKGNILAFTDDDCIVSHNWLYSIKKTFQEDKKIKMLFGKSMPYQEKKHPNLVCPSVFTMDSDHVISKPTFHAEKIGFGNNMAIRRDSLLDKSIYFASWLGPGSAAHAAEDAEISLRMLMSGNKIRYNSKILVFHNKWLNEKESFTQMLQYLCGETACYGYYFFKGHAFTKRIIWYNFNDSKNKFKKLLKIMLQKGDVNLQDWIKVFRELFFRSKGMMIGFIQSKKIQLFANNNNDVGG